MIIDMHTHIVPEHFPVADGRPSALAWPSMQPTDAGASAMVINGKTFRLFRDVCWNTANRVADLPRLGTEQQVLSPLPELLMYQLHPQDGADMARYLNETIAAMVDSEPDSFHGLGTVPLQDVELAIAELRYIKALGLLGVEIRSNVEGTNLGDATLRPVFKEAEALGLAVFVHAYNPTFKDRLPNVSPDIANNAVGFPAEIALAGASLIWDGVLADCPDLRVCMSHGG
ncbi:MAG: amidohydrolase family protein, partial [Dehalococcoidia bacterium]